MKTLAIVSCVLALLCAAAALPTIAPNAQDCGNGIFCAPSQTCMSNATGAGLEFACSPLPNAVRCNDARVSCPASFHCAEDYKCVAVDGSVIDAVANVDPFEVAEMRDFGSGMKPTNLDICGAITRNFRLPNFCRCASSRPGGTLTCSVGLQNYINIGVSAWVMPCASPANVGYRAWAGRAAITQQWNARFQLNVPIPYAGFRMGVADVGARAELVGEVNRMVISSHISIGACASVRLGWFEREWCNPSALRWLPVRVLQGPTFDFSRFCP